MGATEAITLDGVSLGRLQPGEAAAGLALSDAAGWNQTADDWRLFLAMADVFAARAPDGPVVATAALLPYASAAWISLVLVHADWRRRGLATALMRHCLDVADQRSLTCWLDATPAGATVYEQLGFRPAGELVRLRRKAAGLSKPDTPRGCGAGDVAALVAADAAAFGFSRAAVLTEMAGRAGSQLYRKGEAIALVRDGRKARQLGPILAPDEARATALVDDILAGEAGELVIDLAADRGVLRAHLIARGFVEERPFLRMLRGAHHVAGIGEEFMAGAGPEYG
ncbi:GNAT family N-acetyltransferase [Chelatococcus asaccharovorans]|uniref:Acetyltransferase (GNAT) family protein n=1 Tax=Chelatococcus asaccharovorans TaxID=28210 RepID=A0A2V3TYL4_9HYPH|nr:GNAT family N-acetyltransferase [Chelatococcus asaccharovorans]MBS7704711.1 GNAT family N-acetyltransferase [Chelatococcus asaccharovorans]PXW54612.1 acetyltransferase (GNAT) family protein [Chelatococcus asaccharovorans]